MSIASASAVPLARIHGAGPTGLLTALALADAGWQVTVVDPLEPAGLINRSRAYAFTHSSRNLLERLKLWDAAQSLLVPFRHLELVDLSLREQVPFGLDDLPGRLARAPGSAVGWIGQHRALMALLLERAEADEAIRLLLGPREVAGETLKLPEPDLVVAADGPRSPTRAALGIGVAQWPYSQCCLTAQLELRGTDPDQAWELFRAEGPFALLPLGGRQVQVVWSAPEPRCRHLENLDAAAFLDALAGVLPRRFQPDLLLDQQRAFPLQLLVARRLSRGRTVLVGEAAHRCHPVGGQGLNLCWRDVAVLHRLAARVVAHNLPASHLPAAYGQRRWPDLLITLTSTHLMVKLFSNRSPWLLPLRRRLLQLLRRSAPMRRLSLMAMTIGLPT